MSFSLRILILASLLIACADPAMAGKGRIRFIETDVDLRADGSAVVMNTVQWQVLSGELHGFYFEGLDRLPVYRFASDSHAVDSRGNRYGLDISRVGSGRWDIVLANGAGVGSGSVTYRFWFETDFAVAGYLTPTRSAEGRDLMVFNWAPS
jgi:hypothetical protein